MYVVDQVKYFMKCKNKLTDHLGIVKIIDISRIIH